MNESYKGFKLFWPCFMLHIVSLCCAKDNIASGSMIQDYKAEDIIKFEKTSTRLTDQNELKMEND